MFCICPWSDLHCSPETLAAATQTAQRFLPLRAPSPFWASFSQAGLFMILAAALFVVHSRHLYDQSLDTYTGRENASCGRRSASCGPAIPPCLPARACSSSMIPFRKMSSLYGSSFRLPIMIRRSAWNGRNFATPIDPAEYPIFNYLVSIRDGKLEERRVPPIAWEDPVVPVTFTPSTVEPRQSMQMRVGTYAVAAVDIEYQTTWRYFKFNCVASRWTSLNSAGVATIPIPGLQDPAATQITAVRVSGGAWRKASGEFVVR